MDKLLSIIIPVYKVEEYIKECLDSILPQCDNNCEIILVDDGSPDNSPLICDKYKEKNEAIRVIHKENGGLSSARNAGTEIAVGKYIAYLDSDDKIADNAIQGVLKWIQDTDADLCFMQAIKFYADGSVESLGDGIVQSEIRGKSKEKVIEYIASRPKFPGSACTKLYKKSFLIENDIHFPYDRRVSEDLGFCRDCILCAKTYDALDVPYYQYRQNREGSITNTKSVAAVEGLLRFVEESIDILTENEIAKSVICRAAMGFTAYEYIIALINYADLSKNKKADVFQRIDRNKWVIKYAQNKKLRIISMVLQIFGVNLTSQLIGVVYKIKQ